MGTTRTLAADEAFVEGRSQETAAKLVKAAAEADLKGSVRTTYDGYVAPASVVEAAGITPTSVGESSTPEKGEGAPEDTDGGSSATDLFDPSKHNADEVKEYLDGEDVTDEERDRVLAAEAEGKNRKTVLELASTTTEEEGK